MATGGRGGPNLIVYRKIASQLPVADTLTIRTDSRKVTETL